mgnify:FL=1
MVLGLADHQVYSLFNQETRVYSILGITSDLCTAINMFSGTTTLTVFNIVCKKGKLFL